MVAGLKRYYKYTSTVTCEHLFNKDTEQQVSKREAVGLITPEHFSQHYQSSEQYNSFNNGNTLPCSKEKTYKTQEIKSHIIHTTNCISLVRPSQI